MDVGGGRGGWGGDKWLTTSTNQQLPITHLNAIASAILHARAGRGPLDAVAIKLACLCMQH